MRTFVVLTRRADGAAGDFARLADAEVAHVWQGFATGIVRAVHGLVDGPGAALELESPTFDDARAFVEALPYVAAHLLDVRYHALAPFPPYGHLLPA